MLLAPGGGNLEQSLMAARLDYNGGMTWHTRDRLVVWLAIASLALAALACNAFAGRVEPGLPPPPMPSATGAPGETAAPGVAATATLPAEATTAIGQGVVRVLVDLNVRAGPGVGYERVGFMLRDETAQVLGRDPTSGWWKIQCPPRADGNECWVSGGAQYTRAENIQVAPTAMAPATATPSAPTPAPGTGLLSFVDGGRLYAAVLDLGRDLPTAGAALQLVPAASVQRVAIAPDGRTIAFTALDANSGFNELRLVNADGGNERTLVRSADLPRVPEAAELPAAANEDARVQVLDFQWQADGAALAFNTALINPVGYSAGSQSDLWTITPDGRLDARLAAGRGLPRFALSPGNQVIMVGRQEVVRANVDGSGLETVLSFEPSQLTEGFYYPAVQWAAGGAFALVAVSERYTTADDPRDLKATLWRIPTSGSAERLGQVRADVISQPALWSSDGQRLVFVRPRRDSLELVLANGNGSTPETYADGGGLRPLAWRPSGSRLVYAGRGFVAVGAVGERPARLVLGEGEQAARGLWLSEAAYLTEVVAADGSSSLVSVGADGRRELLARLAVAGEPFDVWTP